MLALVGEDAADEAHRDLVNALAIVNHLLIVGDGVGFSLDGDVELLADAGAVDLRPRIAERLPLVGVEDGGVLPFANKSVACTPKAEANKRSAATGVPER